MKSTIHATQSNRYPLHADAEIHISVLYLLGRSVMRLLSKVKMKHNAKLQLVHSLLFKQEVQNTHST